VKGFCPRSKYCHTTDGLSLGGVIRGGVDVTIGRDFALTQTRVCREGSKISLPLTSERYLTDFGYNINFPLLFY